MKLVDDSDFAKKFQIIKGKCSILRTTIKNEKYFLVFEKKIHEHLIGNSSYLLKYQSDQFLYNELSFSLFSSEYYEIFVFR